MKKLLYILFPLIALLLTPDASSRPGLSNRQGTHTLTFAIPDIPGGEIPDATPFPSKVVRKDRNSGIIVLDYDTSNVPDTIKAIMSLAADMWGSVLKNPVPILIRVEYGMHHYKDIADISVLCEVGYTDFGLPCALEIQSLSVDQVDDEAIAFISLSDECEWNCSTDAGSYGRGHNVYTQTLRAIAICLGFGSSLWAENADDAVSFFIGEPTEFDKLLFSNDEYLSDCEPNSPELQAFVVKSPVYALNADDAYRMYTSDPFEYGKSLVYLDNNESLMHYALGEGDKMFRIDNITTELLNAIGWNLTPSAEVRIVSSDVDDTGICSAYSPHSFAVEDKSGVASSPQWKFKVFGLDGREIVLAEGEGDTFETPALATPDLYRKNADGDVEAIVELSYSVSGIAKTAHPFRLSMELKPVIAAIHDMARCQIQGSHLFYVYFVVEYYGADRISVSVEEEYAGAIRTVYSDEPVLAHITTPEMSSYFYSWVDISVSNKYGRATYSVEFEPNFDSYKSQHISALRTLPLVAEASEYLIYNTQGALVRATSNSCEIRSGLAPGVYVVAIRQTNGIVSTEKMIVR